MSSTVILVLSPVSKRPIQVLGPTWRKLVCDGWMIYADGSFSGERAGVVNYFVDNDDMALDWFDTRTLTKIDVFFPSLYLNSIMTTIENYESDSEIDCTPVEERYYIPLQEKLLMLSDLKQKIQSLEGDQARLKEVNALKSFYEFYEKHYLEN